MKKVFWFMILSFSLNLHAQKSLIDERYGFKSIKLDSPRSSFNGLTLFQDKDDLKMYRYYPEDNNLYFVFNKKYDIIYLSFDKTNSLVSIMLTKLFAGYESFNDALEYSGATIDNFSSTFGKFDSVDKETFRLGVVWYGKKSSYSVGTMYFGVEKSESVLIVSKTQELNTGF